MIRMLQQEIKGFSRLIPSNFHSLWSFEDDVLDNIGVNNGIYQGVNNYTNGLINRCINFAHSTSYVRVENDISLSFNDGVNDIETGFSLLINFKSTSTGNQYILTKRSDFGLSNGINKEYQFLLNVANTLYFSIYDQLNGGLIRLSYPWLPTLNTWYHIQVYYDGSGLHTGLKMYVDGVNVGTTELFGTYTSNQPSVAPLIIGTNTWNPTIEDFTGELDELKKSKIVLTDEEALELATKELEGIKVI